MARRAGNGGVPGPGLPGFTAADPVPVAGAGAAVTAQMGQVRRRRAEVIDARRARYLAQRLPDMAANVLKPGRSALIKLLQGAGSGDFIRAARVGFGKVKLMKTAASRPRSPGMYLLAMQFRLV